MPSSGPNTSSPAPKFRVAICGAGPGGLTLATAILKYTPLSSSIAIDIYEAAPEVGTVGAGISVWPRTSALLNAMGLLDGLSGEIGAVGTGISEGLGFTYRLSEQAEEGINFFSLKVPTDPLLIHRSALLTTLQRGLESSDASNCTVQIHTNARLTSYTSHSPTSPITLHFADQPSAQADVLIGADGIRSAVRSTMFAAPSMRDISLKEKVEPRWTGVVAYRSLITMEDLKKVWTPEQVRASGLRAMIYTGKNKHIVSYPISRGALINFVGFYTVPGAYESRAAYPGKWVKDVPVEDVKKCYEGWEGEVQGLLQAHAMETHFGAGAGQSMEDAHILGRLLAHPLTTLDGKRGTTDVTTALKIYEAVRFDFARGVVRTARAVGLAYEFDNGWDLPPSFLDSLRRNDDKATQWLERWAYEGLDNGGSVVERGCEDEGCKAANTEIVNVEER
ncbi:hypothetical protein EWM64_g3302 [Hericium alpestre]|uniref:FAD-binding domain-containing protein n=1 Tax=Hericium alpestre TaxID=135208 RepID=A0A4Z0A3A3_9AGAM|nr:hypothetical protein EWM64_g3302 [Hericium alpestre]